MTKTFNDCSVKVTVNRTTERARILSADKREIVIRNIWTGDNGMRYVQYKNRFRPVSKSSYYTQEYCMW